MMALLLAGGPLLATEVRIELPQETASFKSGKDMELANGQCLACHSVEYVETQPVFSFSFWTAEVKKMRDKFGAAIPEQQIEPLALYLTRSYGLATNLPTSSLSHEQTAVNAYYSSALTGEALATHYGCLSCHNVSKQVVGPPFRSLADKYLHNPQALQIIRGQIHNGGKGKPGAVVMPPFPMVSDSEAACLAKWIMAQAQTTNSVDFKR